jgi:hypothetical protein
MVPEKYNKLFPKIIEFIVTSDEPEETSKLISFIDNNIEKYPALIFDGDDNASSIFYVPYRTKLAPPQKILISSYKRTGPIHDGFDLCADSAVVDWRRKNNTLGFGE